jgi:hypothetical protein
MDQLIATTYNERALLYLSEKQNGNAVIYTQHDDAGNRVNYLSKYPIDLTEYQFAVAQVLRDDLKTYANYKQSKIVVGGVTVDVSADPANPKLVQADTDATGRTNLSGLVALAQMANSFTSTWVQSSGNVKLTSTEIITLGLAVGSFVEQTYQALDAVQTAIDLGKITTTAQIDAYTWPKNS